MLIRIVSGILIILISDFLIYKLIGNLKRQSPGKIYPKVLKITQTSLLIGLGMFAVIWMIIYSPLINSPENYRSQFTFTAVFTAIYFPKLILVSFYILGETIIICNNFIYYIFGIKRKISKSRVFHIRRIFSLTGLVFGLFFLVFIFRSIFIIRSDFKIKEVHIKDTRIPESFEGFRVIQISDMHLGSWTNKNDVIKGIKLAESANPDLVCFTGDLVNVDATEAWPYLPVFKDIKAKFGKYAILGNHDMNDYARIGKRDTSGNDIHNIMRFYDSSGVRLLRNENYIIKKGSDSIAILGVDNWGHKLFRRYGKLYKAIKGCEKVPYKILMTHDPTHWNSEVKNKNIINLTLSGHTHGMQMAFEYNHHKFSPAALIYSNWAGLFKSGNDYLYVNPGFGFLGFPGRIGLKPEITLIILHHQ